MAELPDDFGDRLVAREEVDPMQLDKLRKQVVAVLEMPLSKPVRWWNAVAGALMVVAVIGFAAFIVVDGRWAEQPLLGKAIVASGLGGTLVMGLIMIAVARAGVYVRNRHNPMLVAVSLFMFLGLGVALLHNGVSTGDGQTIFGGTVVLVIAGGVVVMHVLEQYHLATKRKLLELELRLAEIADALERRPPAHGG